MTSDPVEVSIRSPDLVTSQHDAENKDAELGTEQKLGGQARD